MKILALGGSVRGSVKAKAFLQKTVCDAGDIKEYLAHMREHVKSGIPETQMLSNSEILAGVALMGAKFEGCDDVEFYPLLELFARREHNLENFIPEDYGIDDDVTHRDLLRVDPDRLKELVAKVHAADGIILVSPVYFGDRSSVANKFIQLAGIKDLIRNKVIGAVSVGTKRNGGQETTNIFFLYEALNLGAYVVGNGPESSQYGGTAWAGDKGKVLSDEFGIETSFGTGARMMQVCKITHNFPQKREAQNRVRIVMITTMDTPDKMLKEFIQKFIAESGVSAEQAEFRLVELIKGDIERCLACNICPIPRYRGEGKDGRASYACIIRRPQDSMSVLRDELLNADGVVLAGLNLKDMSNVVYRYQAFMERTRFIRRDDFELTNGPIAGFLLTEVGAHINPIHNLKVMTSFMRHNGVMVKPMTATMHQGKIIDSGKEDFLDFVHTTQKFKAARAKTEPIPVSYKALGYGDKRLDHTFALRR